jgi:cobalt-zinc-cadmium efflux system membrane fusion protein
VENEEHLLKFGMFVNGRILRESEEESLIVPRAAIQNMEDGGTVFVVKNEETFEVRGVETGAQTDAESVIAEVLIEGEVIVTQGSFVLKSELLKSELGEE